MRPTDCVAFNYEAHPRRIIELYERTAELIRAMRGRRTDADRIPHDSRDAHGHLFKALTSPGPTYYAGNYRGQDFRCLVAYEVMVQSDSRVGLQAALVPETMRQMALEVQRGLFVIDRDHAEGSTLGREDRFLRAVAFACMVFERFLTVHPYANGNGHAARLIIWAILGRYGYWPTGWTIEPRVSRSDYERLIMEHRSGNTVPLIRAVIDCIAA